jgi:hypothetical protein
MTDCATSSAGGLSVAGFAVIVAIIGWAATHLFSEARERRKEVRSNLDKAFALIDDLRKDAGTFHQSETFGESAAQDLQTRIYRLQRFLTRVPILDSMDVSEKIKGVRKAVTLRNFDRSTFLQQQAGSDVLEEIADACAGLEDELDLQYGYHYPHHFPYILPGIYVTHREVIGRKLRALVRAVRGN